MRYFQRVGWNLTGLLARSHRYRVDTHWCVKDLIVANRGAQIPADVEGQVSVTWPFVSLNCRATRQALTERHKYKTASGGAACTVTFLNLFARSVIEMLKWLYTLKWIQPENLTHVWQHCKVIQPVHTINFSVFPGSCQHQYGRISKGFF